MKNAKAFIFDLNGTMIDDMKYHIDAWSDILNNELHAGLDRDAVKSQMFGKNSELLERIFGVGHFSQEEIELISMQKEKAYQAAFFPHLKLIRGLPQFLEQAATNNFRMAIGSAAIPFNINFVLDNLHLRRFFKSIVSASDVEHSKPDPETFLKASLQLRVPPDQCIVFEDAPKGVEAAQAANMHCIVLTTMHDKKDFLPYKNIIAFVKDYTDPECAYLFKQELMLT